MVELHFHFVGDDGFFESKCISNNVLTYECQRCFCLLEYKKQYHRCPVQLDVEDEGFCDDVERLARTIRRLRKWYVHEWRDDDDYV
ncbi:hypothetical protein SNE40_005823 [Patella caerulea]|uniref:Uncharacterized protein n=1 Tax=Patella caerulea TaxID=87958 RepID=A0AAN8K5A8_PATCE